MASSDPSREFGLSEGYFAQSAFLADEFMEEISRVDLEFARKNAEFGPKPFVRTFERALDKLEMAQSELGNRISQLERSANTYAEDHRKKMVRLKQTFATVGSSFERLETQISEVGSNTIRIGEQLDTVAKEKERAEAIKELVGFYAQLNEGNTRNLDTLLEGGAEGMLKVAQTLRRLNTIVVDNEYSAPSDAAAKRQIEKYSENFEKAMLSTFESAYRDGDVHSMGIAARALDAFNGGVSVVKAYINQHPFFLSSMVGQAHDSIAEASYHAMDGVSDIASRPPPPDRWLVQLYADTRAVMFKDWAIISKVFPRPIDLMQQLLKRVFEQTIQAYLETLLARAESQSKLAFLRVLASSHQETRRLVEDLQKFDAETITPAVMVLETARRSGNNPQGLLDMPGDAQTASAQFSRSRSKKDLARAEKGGDPATIDDEDDLDDEDAARERLGEARSGVSSAVAIAALIGRSEGDSAGVGLLYSFLNRCCDDLFESYTAGGNYMSTEQGHLKDAFRQILVPVVRARSERQGPSRSKALLGMLSSVTGGSGAAAAASDAAGTGGSTNSGSSTATGGQSAETDGSINTQILRMMLEVHAEAITRAIELESETAAPEAVAALSGQLIATLGDDYVFPALEDVLESLQDQKQEPDVRTFDVVQVANVVVRLLQMHFQRAIVPFVGNGNYIYRDVVAEKNQLMSRVEMNLNLIINKFVGASKQWIGGILSKQRKSDFRPAEDDFTAFEAGTQPCRQCTEFLQRVEQACRKNLGEENKTRVLTEVGNALHEMLMEHLRKFVVSVAGGLVLAKDVSRYRETISGFGIAALNDKFAVLQDISNIFLVQPSALKSLLEEGPLARQDRATVQAFVQMREDSRSSSLVKQFAS
ncbi:Exocyst complex component 5 [Coemansia sp. RSA 990]|nr:Exocyst complex component 5 [Coemansia sp. RSA 1086]KAJ1752667.1 Exocyst complex component 5 [Coemansia sp. RSA 1821]KAJ1874702.1 Exocyst complex component 5 [Coemansia sp. RSA 990]KAJ2673691.1 Exocyst complex component 5 [Coemansia sp. RSA 1085]